MATTVEAADAVISVNRNIHFKWSGLWKHYNNNIHTKW